ncbi:MAG: hypothetical protein IE891_03090 [Flavobacteriaceae bacterium]|nr:hypothetical protein [Flavobacteriaceae bacterium]
MEIVKKIVLNNKEKETLLSLWNIYYPEQFYLSDFDDYLKNKNTPNHYLVISRENILGWLFTYTLENEIFFALIVDNKIEKKGQEVNC